LAEFQCKDSGERRQFASGAVRDMAAGKGRMDLLSPFANIRTSKWLEKGAEKYGPHNWEKGIPFSSLLDSTMRHLQKYLMGWRDEDHLAAARFGVDALMHFEELGRTDLDDLPHYQDGPQEDAGKVQA
jgi:hypothetical protein